MTIIYQLLQFYLLICMRIQRFIFAITVKASNLVIHLAVQAFTARHLSFVDQSIDFLNVPYVFCCLF